MIWNRLFGRPRARQRLCRHCSRPFRPERIGVVCRAEPCANVEDDLGRRGPRFFFADEQGLWAGGPGGAPRLALDGSCPSCRRSGRLASVCPHCRRPLGVESGEDRVIAVIGASASGKSHFLAAVLHQLLDGRVGGETWRVALERPEIDRLRERLLDPLFEELHVLPSTLDRLDEELALPLENLEDGRRVLLVFRDLGGELFRQPERLARVAFLRYAQGVVLMVDPLAFEPVAPAGAATDGTGGDGRADDGGGLRRSWRPNGQPDAHETLDVYRKVLDAREPREEEAALPVRPEQKILALAVTKADLVLPDEHPFWRGDGDAHLRPGYWSARADADEAAERWVRRYLDPQIERATGPFSDTGYFFVSSFGFRHPPGEERLAERPRPLRVHEPIFALLDRLTGGEEGTAGAGAVEGGASPGRSRAAGAADPDDWGL